MSLLIINIRSVDTTAPTVVIQGAPSTFTDQTPFNVSFVFSESVTGFDIGDITLANATASNFVASSGSNYTADITPDGSNANITIDVSAGVAIDGSGNNNTAATQVVVSYQPPVSTIFEPGIFEPGIFE